VSEARPRSCQARSLRAESVQSESVQDESLQPESPQEREDAGGEPVGLGNVLDNGLEGSLRGGLWR
jgi:hypothetical protein